MLRKPFASISRPVFVLGIISLCTDMASEMLYPVTPIYLTGVLGASMFQLGLIEGLAEALASFLKAFFGSLSDSWGKRTPFVVAGYILSALSKPIPGLWQSFNSVVFARLSDRLGKAIRTAPRDALLAHYAPKDRQGTVFGFHRAMDTLGAAIGPSIALIYLYFRPGHYVTLFFLAFAPSIAASVLTLFIRDNQRVEVPPAQRGLFAYQRKALREGGYPLRRLFLAVLIFSLVNSSDVFLIMKAKQSGLSDTYAIGAYIFYNLLYAGTAFPFGGLSDTWGKKRALSLGFGFYVISYLCFALATTSLLIWVGFLIYALYAACSESIIKAWVSELSSSELKGSALGLLTSIMSLGALCSSVVAGYCWEVLSPAAPFYIAAIGALVALAILPHYERSIS